MTRILTIFLTLTPAMALAHPGDHGSLGFRAAMDHALTQSSHVIGALAVLLVPVLLYRLIRGRR